MHAKLGQNLFSRPRAVNYNTDKSTSNTVKWLFFFWRFIYKYLNTRPYNIYSLTYYTIRTEFDLQFFFSHRFDSRLPFCRTSIAWIARINGKQKINLDFRVSFARLTCTRFTDGGGGWKIQLSINLYHTHADNSVNYNLLWPDVRYWVAFGVEGRAFWVLCQSVIWRKST